MSVDSGLPCAFTLVMIAKPDKHLMYWRLTQCIKRLASALQTLTHPSSSQTKIVISWACFLAFGETGTTQSKVFPWRQLFTDRLKLLYRMEDIKNQKPGRGCFSTSIRTQLQKFLPQSPSPRGFSFIQQTSTLTCKTISMITKVTTPRSQSDSFSFGISWELGAVAMLCYLW